MLFLILIAPFDIEELNFSARLEILPVYGLITFLVYVLLIPFQNWLFKKTQTWNIVLELLFLTTFYLLLVFICFAYYNSAIVNGNYGFQKFTKEIFLPICFILLPIIIFLRWFLNKQTSKTSENYILITGDNKLDVFKLHTEELVAVSSADNYVEVNYLNNGKLQKKLLRNTLKAVQVDVPFLLKVHRSHLINPSHFKAWNGSNMIILTQMEIPVSKTYKAALLDLNQSSLKTNTSSQS